MTQIEADDWWDGLTEEEKKDICGFTVYANTWWEMRNRETKISIARAYIREHNRNKQ